MELDHVLIAVTDLEAVAREVETRIGLSSVEGGAASRLGHGEPDRAARIELLELVRSWIRESLPEQFRSLGRRWRD